ncbi:MAG TPA: AAA family ATPase [Methylomirabilota bacterium]|nr:AAA family ATPase [Methylomirabilota bacterium]
MWIERVIARAFGPLHDETLHLGAGMNVIGGPNEAGKTSWHAATRLALTGVRRGPGRTKEVASVIDRHRPWDSPEHWEVEARLHLQDGRTVDISQDLAGKVACRARDVTLGDDLSSEIINDGTPDATRWLGLDRESYSAVAAVSQAQIMAVAESATGLQDEMQRAAATRGTDATAAEAIERLKAFRKESVGAVRVGATGPMWAAMREQEAADAAVIGARRLHGEYLDRESRLEAAQREHLATERDLVVAEAALAVRDATQLSDRVQRAADLAARYPEAPAALATRDELADEVAGALDSWRRRPAPVALNGPSAEELQQQLAAIPVVPAGDRRPDRSVIDAARTLDLADEALRQHLDRSPAAASLEVDRVPASAPSSIPLLGAAGLGLLGLALVAIGQAVAGIGLLGVAGIIGAVILRGRSASQPVLDERGAAERHARAVSDWEAETTGLRGKVQEANERLRAALIARGAATDEDLRAAVAAYELECAAREDVARAAAGADGLRRAVEARNAAEDAARRVATAVSDAEAAVRAAAEHIGEGGDGGTAAAVERLLAWQRTRAEMAKANETGIREWQELQGLLAGGSLTELQAEADRRRQVAARLAARVGDDAVIPVEVDSEVALTAAREAASRSKAVVDELSGELRLLATTLASVAEAEERVAAARTELGRVQNLAAVIDETLNLLEAAERRVHRDVAPILTASVQRHLPAITGGAYVEVGMNPRDLSVDVKEARTGQWRDARLLSEGTREQIYLLLRVAMAEHLVTTDESAPLLLDEVTAQSDPERKLRMLDVLHALSADRQIVLFSHDAEVMEWAALALREPRDRLIWLGVPTIAPEVPTPLAEAASR